MRDQAERTVEDYLVAGKQHWIDENPMPVWAEGPNGRSVSIKDDERFPQLWEVWRADACHHDRRGIVHWVNGGNAPCFNWFCGDCGLKLGPNIPRVLAEKYGVVDPAKATLDSLASRTHAYVADRERQLNALKSAAAERCQPENRRKYAEDLQTPEWRELRARVLDRARGVCEGCLDAPASQVHHLTYDHKGAEFAFELRALCDACHERIHKVAA